MSHHDALSLFPARGGSPSLSLVRLRCTMSLPRTRGFTGGRGKLRGVGAVSSSHAGVHRLRGLFPHRCGQLMRRTSCEAVCSELAGTWMTAIAKTDRETGATRSLIGHSLDVAHCVHEMLNRGVARGRMSIASGIELTDVHAARLAVLAGLHDMGKATNGFQDRINGRGPGTGHVAEAVAVMNANGKVPDAVRSAALADTINQWCDDPASVLYAIFCHHGEPVPEPRIGACTAALTQQWAERLGYDPVAEVGALTKSLLDIFAPALDEATPLPEAARFQHALAGLIMTADWMGSDTRFHPVVGSDDRPQAARNLLDSTRWSGWHSGTHPEALLGSYKPRAAQISMLSLPLTERLVIIEAPTGSGKTEASLIWADRLAEAGLVDGMYFAVPTRSAATELHARISEVMGRVHPLVLGRVVRAVPGMIDTDHAANIWDEPTMPTWALGSARRVMGAPIAVGTIDQAMLSQLRTKHSWLRAWCLARQLLVIDEVHASDPYMSEIITRLVNEHLALGGYVLLMSATLGEILRAKLRGRPRLECAAAIARPYPQVVTPGSETRVETLSERTTRIVINENAAAMDCAIETVTRNEAVLWIRSTVADALDDFRSFRSRGANTILHHSRFADVDRQYLDREVLRVLGPGGQRAGVIIVGTQTLEQSLDIDADLLVTDAVPADVLLQRLGRLHRHRLGTTPLAILLEPGIWDERVGLDGRPLGGAGQGWAWVYSPLAVRETVQWLRVHDHVSVPGDVREMVELATHADHLEVRARIYGKRWEALWQRLYGKAMAEGQQALSGLVDRTRDYAQALVNERVPTRLGDGSVDVEVEGRLISPFTGERIDALSIRSNWLRGAAPSSRARIVSVEAGGRASIDVGGVRLAYDEEGLHRIVG
jgi:CRISPR-associated endonuclease/helicase Cas3